MEKKEYLNEENYQKGKKKLFRISLIVLIVGIVIGLWLIITGIIISNNAKGFNIDLNSEQENSEVLRTESEVQSDINTLKPKISSLNSEVTALEMELWKIQVSEGMTDNYYAKQKEKEAKETELLTLETKLKGYQDELKKIQSSNNSMDGQLEQFEGIFNSTSDNISKARAIPCYMFGAFIIIASGIISLSIYLFAKRREITAFTVQQTMPLAQEGIDKMSPSVGKVAKEVTKGIKSGLDKE